MADYNQHFQSFMNGSLSDLKHYIDATFGSRLDRIQALVESLEKRKLMAEMCTADVCGGHGTCDLSEDWTTTVCQCEIGYRGTHCETNAPCDAAHDKYVHQSPMLMGAEEPLCSDDGMFAAVQYMGTDAYCVTNQGYKIENYSIRRWHSEGMNCRCARDWDAYIRDYATRMEEQVFNCTPSGNYAPYVCDSTSCTCQDSYGQKFGDPVPFGVEHALGC